jgi:hypothetical protein
VIKWYLETKNDENVKNKYKFVKENFESKYYSKVTPTKNGLK